MKILLINGSPKGKRSNSLKLAYSFIEGFKNGCTDDEESISIDELHVASMNIAACKGCFACWQKTPGICCIKDDMQKVIEKLIDADLILWSFPLYYFNIPGILKNLIDRQLPMSLPFMSSKQNGYGMLIPWITFWIAVSIHPKVGALITLLVVATVPFIMRKHKFVIWDQLSMAAVAILSAAANITGNGVLPTNIGYL